MPSIFGLLWRFLYGPKGVEESEKPNWKEQAKAAEAAVEKDLRQREERAKHLARATEKTCSRCGKRFTSVSGTDELPECEVCFSS